MADQISDAVLDRIIAIDPMARVACETLITTGVVVLAGEITTTATVNTSEVVRETIRKIGYTDGSYGFNAHTCAVMTAMDPQSSDIAMGVDTGGAGDQGMMFGYACDETPELMPVPIMVAHGLTRRLAEVRKNGELAWLRPDGKSQVTIEYVDNKPVGVKNVVLSTQHAPEISHDDLSDAIKTSVIRPVLARFELETKGMEFHINPTGRFVVGGPQGDAGLTGRKIIVDTYGGAARHGGGAFSGKDPSKVDRSAAYATRWVAKTVVAAGFAKRCEVQVAYAIGVPEPVSIMVQTFGTGNVPETALEAGIREVFDLTPRGILKALDLRKPIYSPAAAYGHFGRATESTNVLGCDARLFGWEDTSRVNDLRDAVRKAA